MRVLARAVKAVLWSWSPLATGEPEAATYERRVYHTADRRCCEMHRRGGRRRAA